MTFKFIVVAAVVALIAVAAAAGATTWAGPRCTPR